MSAGGSSGSQDTRFARQGTVNTSSWRDLTSDQHNLFNTSFANLNDSGANPLIQPMAIGKMSRVWDDVPYTDAICDVIRSNLPGNPMPGNASLTAQAGVNPYSSDYADNTFGRYQDEVYKLLGGVRSGPSANRGGTAAQGYMQSDAINQMALNREDVLTKNRAQDAQIQQSASGMLTQQKDTMDRNAIGGMQSGWSAYGMHLDDQTKGGQLISERAKMYADLVPAFTTLASVMRGYEDNALSGRGAQTNSNLGYGVNFCCFIFLEQYHGKLPESVRRYRDEFAPENSSRRIGYRKMSRWLVPAMRVSGFWRKATGCLLTGPLKAYGEWYYGNNKWGWLCWPIKAFWFKTWEITGKQQTI